MTLPKKHHFLPQFYLEFFKISPQTGRHPHIWQIEKAASPKTVNSAIKDTGCKTDYHTLDFKEQDKDRQKVEEMFSRLESEQANLVKEICEANQITETNKVSLADFITTMRFRVPAFKRYIESSLKNTVSTTYKLLDQQGILPTPPKKVEKLIQDRGYDFIKFDIANWFILQFMLDMSFNSENSAILKAMKYQLFLAPDEHHFITADSPVALYHPNYESVKPYGVGPAFKEVEITFPLAKSHLVKLSWEGKEGTIEVQEDHLLEYNRRTIIMADKYIYSCLSNDYLQEQVAWYHNISAGYKVDNLWYGKGAYKISRFIPVTN